jgi:hypothetical protein
MKLIESKTLTSTTTAVEFTSIPQDGTDLLLLISSRDNGTNGSIQLYFNGTLSNWNVQRMDGYGSGSPAAGPTTNPISTFSNISTETANNFSNCSVYIPNYSGSTAKSLSADNVVENNATAALASVTAGRWDDTSAITVIRLDPLVGDFVSGCIFSLYKITKGSDGIVTTS